MCAPQLASMACVRSPVSEDGPAPQLARMACVRSPLLPPRAGPPPPFLDGNKEPVLFLGAAGT